MDKQSRECLISLAEFLNEIVGRLNSVSEDANRHNEYCVGYVASHIAGLCLNRIPLIRRELAKVEEIDEAPEEAEEVEPIEKAPERPEETECGADEVPERHWGQG